MFRKEKRSFGEYFDDQRDKIVQDMQTGKNAERTMINDREKKKREDTEKNY